jgi:hypothetical protein
MRWNHVEASKRYAYQRNPDFVADLSRIVFIVWQTGGVPTPPTETHPPSKFRQLISPAISQLPHLLSETTYFIPRSTRDLGTLRPDVKRKSHGMLLHVSFSNFCFPCFDSRPLVSGPGPYYWDRILVSQGIDGQVCKHSWVHKPPVHWLLAHCHR